MPGHLSEICNPERSREAAPARPLSLQWITDELLETTRRVWSKAYGRIISEEEAVEILMNVKRLAETLLAARRGDMTT